MAPGSGVQTVGGTNMANACNENTLNLRKTYKNKMHKVMMLMKFLNPWPLGQGFKP